MEAYDRINLKYVNTMIIVDIMEWDQVLDCELSEEAILILAYHYGLEYEATELLSQGYSPQEIAQELDLL